MNAGTTPAGPVVRIGFAFTGLVAGLAAQLLFLFVNAVVWALWNNPRGGREDAAMLLGVTMIGTVAFSLAGWALVGVPFALAFTARRVARMPWALWFAAGPFLGIIALLLISLLISVLRDSQPGAEALFMLKIFWWQSLIVSTVAFAAYAALLRRRLRRS